MTWKASLFAALAALILIIALWVAVVRPWLRKQSWAGRFFDAIEPLERGMYLKSETILWARTQAGVGLMLETLTQVGAIDFGPILDLLPPQYSWLGTVIRALPVIVMLLGLMQERMRRDTTKPLVTVSMPNDAPPEVRAAVVEADEKAAEAAKLVREVA